MQRTDDVMLMMMMTMKLLMFHCASIEMNPILRLVFYPAIHVVGYIGQHNANIQHHHKIAQMSISCG